MRHAGKRACSGLLAAAMLAASAWNGMTASAKYTKDECDKWADGIEYHYYEERGDNQPWVHSYIPESILDWSPETDPYAKYNRALVPVQDRIGANTDTQANPDLTAQAQLLVLAGDYQNGQDDMWNAGYLTQYGDNFARYCFNFWQYMDYYGTWHGEFTTTVPEELLDMKTDAIMKKFEHGLLMLPNPAYTNAAHKNGAKSIAVIAPEPVKKGQLYTVLLQQDENGDYPVAKKLVEMKEYYGFDGYFVNEEDKTTFTKEEMKKFKEFMQYMRNEGCYVQWYDAINDNTGRGQSYENQFNANNSPFVQDSELGRVSDSIFLNYWWDKAKLKNSASHAISLGLDPLESVFVGIEGGGNRWQQPYDIALNKGENGQPMNSIAIIGSDMPNDVGKDETGEYRDKYKNENQWKVFERERIWWSGPSEDPTNTGRTSLSRPDIGIRRSNWDGVADQIVEKSVIQGTNFHTNFNTGHGLKYYIDGQVSNEHEWNNINLQDILPTWQWWVDSTGTKLQADFDYGTGYDRGTQYSYTPIDPYRGGDSLVVSGTLDAENFLRLYKSELNVNAGSKAVVTFKKSSDDAAAMKLGLLFKDAPDTLVRVDIDNTSAQSADWVTSTVDLSAYAGKEIAAFGLVFDGTADAYQMNIGELKITDNSLSAPDTPTGLKIDKSYNTGEMAISWTLGDYDAVKQYNVYAVVDGQERYMGGTYDEVFYIKDLYDPKGEVTIKLTAVGADGQESAPATVTHTYPADGLPDISVTAEDGKLNVSYGSGAADITVTTVYETSPRTWTATGTDGAAVVNVASGEDADGAQYTMRITLGDGTILDYDGRLDDSYCAPYEGKVLGNGSLTNPAAVSSDTDWYKLTYEIVMNGETQPAKTITRYLAYMNMGANLSDSLPKGIDGIYVTLEDYNGNKSKRVYVDGPMSITLESASDRLTAGESLQITATVKNHQADNTVIWSVDGATSRDTVIDQTGLLKLGRDETAKTVTVKAVSKEDKDYSAAKTITIDPLFILNPSSGDIYRGESTQLNIEDDGAAVNADKFTWSITSAKADGTAIDGTGLLTVDPAEEAASIEIQAVSKENSKMIFKGKFTVKPAATLRLKDAAYASTGCDVTFIVTYKGAEEDLAGYDWSVTSNDPSAAELAEGTSITNGLLTVDADEKATSVKVTATKKGDNRVAASLAVNVREDLENDIAKGKTILAGSYSWGDSNALIDGDEDTQSAFYGSSGWIVIDLGKRYDITRWKTVNPGEGEEGANKTYALEVLTDEFGVDEEQLADKSFLADPANWEEVDLVDNSARKQIVNRPLSVSVSARYVRIRVDEGYLRYGYSNYWGFNEIELFADHVSVDQDVTGVTVTPGSVTLKPGDSQQFAASVTGEAPSPEVTAVTLTPAESTALPGDTITFTAKVKGRYLTEKDVIWKLEGATDEATVLTDNVLTIGEAEETGTLTITATAKADETQSATAKITILEPPDEVEVSLTEDSIVKSEKIQTGTGNSWEDVEYIIDGDLTTKGTAVGQNLTAGTTPNSYLIVDVGEENAAKGISSIDAYAALEKSKPTERFGAKKVKLSYSDSADGSFIEAAAIELKAEEGYWDNESPYPNHVIFQQPIKARYFKYEVVEWYSGWGAIWDFTLYASNASGEDNSPTQEISLLAVQRAVEEDPDAVLQRVIWSVEGARSAGTAISETGLLTVGSDEQASTLTVKSVSSLDDSKYGTARVTVKKESSTPSYSGGSSTPSSEFYVNVIAGANGSIKEADGFYPRDEKYTFTAIPDEGYVIDSVTLDDGSVVSHTDTQFTLLVNEPYEVRVTFKKAAEEPAPSTDKPTPSKNPQTGAEIPIEIPAALLLLSGGLALLRKKIKGEEVN